MFVGKVSVSRSVKEGKKHTSLFYKISLSEQTVYLYTTYCVAINKLAATTTTTTALKITSDN